MSMQAEATTEMSERDRFDNQVITYKAPWSIFALSFSHRQAYPFRLAIGSFQPEIKNQVEIIQLDQNKSLQRKARFSHDYPPTKLLFHPMHNSNDPDLLATSGECLKIWRIVDNSHVVLQKSLKNDNQFSAPLTSFDWNPQMPHIIGTSSIDTTCTMWDLERGEVFTQLIAHDKEVYDIHFSRERNIFASAGADGSVRQFDMRDLQHSAVLYETDRGRPILKLAWNRKQASCNYLACIEMQTNYVTLVDSRKSGQAMMKLTNHRDCVNALAWAPQSAYHMCTVGDDSKAYIWDLNPANIGRVVEYQTPLLQYKADQQISNLSWSSIQAEWLSICYLNQLQVLRL